ncbi:hypothetical protein Tco_0469199 [Tanacetum coccineum]
MEGLIKEDDDESCYEQMRRWNINTNYDDAYETNHENNEKEELSEVHELPVCNIRWIYDDQYSFNIVVEFVAGPRERNIDEVGGMHIFWNSVCVLFVLGFRRFSSTQSCS